MGACAGIGVFVALSDPRPALDRFVADLHQHLSKPEFDGVEIDRTTGAMTIWARFPKPGNVLVPDLKVRVTPRVAE
jgi:hypothetical protein